MVDVAVGEEHCGGPEAVFGQYRAQGLLDTDARVDDQAFLSRGGGEDVAVGAECGGGEPDGRTRAEPNRCHLPETDRGQVRRTRYATTRSTERDEEQERARARRRQQKLDAREAQRAKEAARNRQVAVVVVAVLVVVALFVFLASKVGGSPAASPAASRLPRPPPPPPPADGRRLLPRRRPRSPSRHEAAGQGDAAGKTFEAVITTNCGDITLDLDGAKAPQTVASFVALAKGGYWADSPCHRLTTRASTSCSAATPWAGPDRARLHVRHRERPQDGAYPKGTIAMARTSDPNSNGGPVLHRVQGHGPSHRAGATPSSAR